MRLPRRLGGGRASHLRRHTGVGADGWMLIEPASAADHDTAIRLFNSDGSERRSPQRYALRGGLPHRARLPEGRNARADRRRIKRLRLLERADLRFVFEMNMGRPEFTAERFQLPLGAGARDVTLVWVGNPQCAMPVADFDFDWRALGAEIECHPQFPQRTNVSFLARATSTPLEVRFWERGAGETMSSGTGSTGAFAAAVQRGLVRSPARVVTPAGPMEVRWDADIFLTGPAEIVAEGVFLPTSVF